MAGTVLHPFALNHTDAMMGSDDTEHFQLNIAYFDALLSLLPANVYFSDQMQEDDDAGDGGNSRFFKNVHKTKEDARVLHKQKRSESKRVRFEGGVKSVPEMLLEQANKAKSVNADASAKTASTSASGFKRKRSESSESNGTEEPVSTTPRSAPAASIDELRARLQKRIEQLSKTRKTTHEEGIAGKVVSDDAATNVKTKKQLQQTQKAGAATNGNVQKGAKATAPAKKTEPPTKKARVSETAVTKTVVEADDDDYDAPETFDFGIAFGAEDGKGDTEVSAGAGDAKKVSKRERLKKMLKEAEKTQHKLAKLEAEGNVHAKVEKQFATALQRAEGKKILDDPKLIAKSLKKMEKSKAKSAEMWEKRKAQNTEAQAERQRERSENIKTKKFRAQLHAAEKAEAAKVAARQAKAAERREEGGGGGGGGAATTPAAKNRAGFEGRGGKSFINKA